MDAATIRRQALYLSAQERLELARLLLESISLEEQDDTIPKQQIIELRNRMAAFQQQQMTTLSGEQLRQRLISKYGFSS